jgi:hypothetical protein
VVKFKYLTNERKNYKMILIYIIAIIFTIYFWKTMFKIYENKNNLNINKYKIKNNPMTITERKFFYILKEICDKYNLIILPQVNFQEIFELGAKNDYKSFNKIKAKSVDFAIVDKNYYYKCFIELDDYTHKRQDRIKRDIFVNTLFKNYNLKLYRINVKNDYNKIYLENIIKEVV